MKAFTRIVSSTLAISGLLVGALALTPAVAGAAKPPICTGSADAPGVLAGTYASSVVVTGVCAVNGGVASIRGTLTIGPGAALLAAFARNDLTGKGSSVLRVFGKVVVDKGGTLLLGCDAASFACLDDPNQMNPTLNSRPRIAGDIISRQPLGVVVHNTAISGSVDETGGGGGETCDPSGIFAVFGSPVYSDYENSSIHGNLDISRVTSCWMGTIRDRISGSATFKNNQLADPDAIEILSNHVFGNISCRGNSMVWDSSDYTGSLFPRQPEPNTIQGKRSGQCVLSSPTSPGGPSGPGPF
jgi:hypothetical protein